MTRKSTSLDQYNTLLEEFRSGKIKPVYAFFGEETFFSDRLQEAAISVIPEEARDFNLDILYGQEVTVDKVIDICRSYPMMTERRAVIVRDFMKMFTETVQNPGESKDKPLREVAGKEADAAGDGVGGSGSMDDLIAYLDRPNPSTLLMLINDKRPSATTRLGKALKQGKTLTANTFEAVPDYLLKDWITGWASAEHHLPFKDDAAQLLGYHVGNHLQQLTVEIEKLSNYRKDGGAITNEDVRQVVRLSREFTIFNFSDALLERKTEKALFVAHHMIQNAEFASGEVIKMIGYLYTTFGKIWHIQRLLQKGWKASEIRKETGVNSTFYYDKLCKAGNNYPVTTCPRVFEILLDADRAIKGFSRETPEAILLMTIKKLTS